MRPILTRRAAKYVRGGFRVCYLCGTNSPDEVHHTSYFPEECVAVCASCHSYIHTDSTDTGLEPDQRRPQGYEKTRREQEAAGDGVSFWHENNPVHRHLRKVDSARGGVNE